MKDNFNNIINSNQAVLVDFFATWCGPCQQMPPILSQLKKLTGDKLRIIKIDIDKNPKLAQQYHVMSVPMLALFKNGKMIWRKAGAMPANVILNEINQYL